MEEQDILDAPIKIMLFTWLNDLFQNGNAQYNNENNNIIDLDSYASSWFSIGRNNDNLKGYIGIPQALCPWFYQLGFKHAVVSKRYKRIYISCGNEEDVGLTLSFKIREKRISLLWNENLQSKIQDLEFRIFNIKADNSISITEDVVWVTPMIRSDDLRDVVYNEEYNISTKDAYSLEAKENLKNEYLRNYVNIDQDDEDDDNEWK